MGKQTQILRHIGNAAVLRGQMGDIPTVQEDFSPVRWPDPKNRLEEQGLSSSGGAEKEEESPLLDLQVDVFQCKVPKTGG